MKGASLLITVLVLLLFSCDQEDKHAVLQGDWRKEGFVKKAFTISGDSIIYPGLPNRYLYELKEDTLIIHFTSRSTKSPVLSLSPTQLVIFDAAVTKDTVRLEKMDPPATTE